jgi:hypothetical protein
MPNDRNGDAPPALNVSNAINPGCTGVIVSTGLLRHCLQA